MMLLPRKVVRDRPGGGPREPCAPRGALSLAPLLGAARRETRPPTRDSDPGSLGLCQAEAGPPSDLPPCRGCRLPPAFQAAGVCVCVCVVPVIRRRGLQSGDLPCLQFITWLGKSGCPGSRKVAPLSQVVITVPHECPEGTARSLLLQGWAMRSPVAASLSCSHCAPRGVPAPCVTPERRPSPLCLPEQSTCCRKQ